MRPRRIGLGKFVLLAGPTFASFIGFTGCGTPERSAISVLRDPIANHEERLGAIRKLQAGGKQAVLQAKPELVEAIATSPDDIQRAAEEALTLAGPEVASDLVEISLNAHATVGQVLSHASVLRILRQTSADDKVVEQVVVSTTNSDFTQRLHATELLGALGVKNGSALTDLTRLISDQDPLIRIAAINEASDLQQSGGAILIPAFIGALDDPTMAVREAACIGLGNMGPSAIRAKSSLERVARVRDTRLAQLAQIAIANVTATNTVRR
jgi:hypothetical protein